MTGSIAEVYCGVSYDMEEKALAYLADDLIGTCYAFDSIKMKRMKRS